MKKIELKTADDYTLVAHQFEPEATNGNVILINSATGVKQQFYFKFAKFLTQRGYHVVTYDYRGIGMSRQGSLVGFAASYRDWANKDFTRLSDYLNTSFPKLRKILIGHSFGGSSIGLSPNANQFDAYITVAAQFCYWKLFNRSYQFFVLWGFYIIIPLLSRLYGYFPSKLKGLGEELPKGVALDWATIITHPDSLLELARQSENHYETITKPMLMISFSDDKMAPKKTVDELARRVYSNAQVERLHIEAEATKPIGHMNFFSGKFESRLWSIPDAWISKLQLG